LWGHKSVFPAGIGAIWNAQKLIDTPEDKAPDPTGFCLRNRDIFPNLEYLILLKQGLVPPIFSNTDLREG
jgi:hypothetical protein